MPSPPSSARRKILKDSPCPLCTLSPPATWRRPAKPTETLGSGDYSCSLFYNLGALLKIVAGEEEDEDEEEEEQDEEEGGEEEEDEEEEDEDDEDDEDDEKEEKDFTIKRGEKVRKGDKN